MKTLKRRRKENKTDYLKRLKLLKSGLPRIVVRITNKHILAQYVVSKEAQDTTVLGLSSKVLLKHGWPEKAKGSLKSIPSSYLLGFLMGTKIIKRKLEMPIIDFGLQRVIRGSKLQAFIKGLLDSGLKISHKEEVLPKKEIVNGKCIKEKINIEEIKQKMEKEK